VNRLLKTAIALAIAVSGSSRASSPGGLRLMAKEIPHIAIRVEDIKSELTRNGANVEAVRNQVELAIRRCGFTIDPLSKVRMSVKVSGLSQEGSGYSGIVLIHVWIGERVRGELVLIEGWSEGMTISGPSGGAAPQIRDVISHLLDQFCNEYLKAREEVHKGAKGG